MYLGSHLRELGSVIFLGIRLYAAVTGPTVTTPVEATKIVPKVIEVFEVHQKQISTLTCPHSYLLRLGQCEVTMKLAL